MFGRLTEGTLARLRMDYIVFGRGTKPLVLVQGLNTRGIRGAGASLALMYRIFAKQYRIYLFDRRREIRADVTVRELARDLAAGMDELGIRQADVVGVSQGGMIAQYLAIDRPDLVSRLVLAVTLSRTNAVVRAVIENWIRLTEAGDFKTLTADMAVKMYSESYLKRYRPFLPLLTIAQKPKDPERFIRLAKSCLTCDAYDSLDQIHCPVFVIGGQRDQIVTGEASREIAERLGCPICLYEHLGHAAYEEAKDFNRRVLAFLQS